MNKFKWTEDKTNQLKELYPKSSWELLKQEFPISRHALHEYARRRGLKREVSDRRQGDLTPLLDDSLITYYWIGFILADGCILNNGQLIVSLSNKDKKHLQKLALFLSTKVRIFKQDKTYKHNKNWNRPATACRIVVSDPKVTQAIRLKYDIKQKKTYNPPNLESLKLTKEQQISLMIGFIDGDGWINHKSRYIKIENHVSWNTIHKFFADIIKVAGITSRTFINKRGYSEAFLNTGSIEYLKSFITKHNLPILKRKWDE